MNQRTQPAPVESTFRTVKVMASAVFAADPVEQHPLFVAMEERVLSRAEAHSVALQVFHVVDCFPRFLAALLSNLDDTALRMPLVENLYCEHGRMDAARVHVTTYRDFLRAIGLDDATIDASRPGVAVIAYTRAVLDLCLHHPAAEGLGALGVIEETVARVSPIVARFGALFQAVTPEARSHFGVHEVLDLEHADEIYELAAICWDRSPDAAAQVERGLALGHYYQRRLYSDLLPGR